ncbi:hypothetical protein LTR10_014163 [Elasticomyces elasticus]|uniref:Phosphoribosylaminoimidazole-succinocarboxamide synthase n=1 Tax=Exophiala sideris TaxID=1016849 RepID=A0ABR0J3H3_9EURO|nr:hypothetical protein LTR10_014163 [Elasticomyces elasticus]KAK5026570.1 hypothetical protein LTS07_007504 [Exophiala sideris]KAK5033690.1 hypothetical protein LTR13_006742 [Exophiala sideris]KAK5055513.1 hypothetical protein LTR69_008346 [Exophiala sideris]KAK5180105.1 hypothetical protein LTR44_007581 [Eurotiomycetes sp. CCFEE 6388]
MNLVPDAHIQTVKSLTPQYLRSHSLKSSVASNEYFSDYASEASSQNSDDTKASYETPPSRISTPPVQQHLIDSEMTLPTRPGATQPAPLNTRHNPSQTMRMLSSFDEMSPPTPGVDDTPYIRFAIEQLTRDEDVLGRGRHSTASPVDDPLSPILPLARPVSVDSRQTPTSSPPPPTPPQQPPPQPIRQIQRKPVPQEVMIPVDLSKDLRSQLGFVPTPLRLPILALFMFLCLLIIAGLIFSLVFISTNHALFDYDGNATPRYFVFQYLPQLLGIILLLWLFVIEAAAYRCLPYFCMTSGKRNPWVLQNMRILPANYLLPDFSFFRTGESVLGVAFLIFWLSNFTVPLLACLYQTQWITNDGPARFRWTTVQSVGWTLVALYGLLCLAIVYCIVRFRRRNSNLMWDPRSIADLVCLFRRSNGGSRFEQSEIAPDPGQQLPPKTCRLGFWTTSERPDVFHGVGVEYAPIKRLSMQHSKATEKPSGLRLHPNDTVDTEAQQRHSYGSVFSRNIHSPYVRYRWTIWFLRDSAVLAWIIAALILMIAFLVVSFVNRAVQDGFSPLLPSLTRAGGFSPANFLYSFIPALLGMILFLAWQPIAMYFRAVQPFCNLSRPSGADARHSLLLSYPACGPVSVIILALRNGDYKVAYISFIALLSLSIPVLAGGVFTAEFFTAQNKVKMVASMPGYIALCVIVTSYALSYLVIWPTRKRYLPHNINTIAALLSWLYASPLLGDSALQNVTTRGELIERLTRSSSSPGTLTGDGAKDEKRGQAFRQIRRVGGNVPRFAFGIFVGRDGLEHLGIDRLQRPGSREMLVVPPSR